ncbi:MAG: GTP cyclohydrolase, FolE2/MptA family, partial [Candidatus Cloacimonadota bacterium]|nr:GTP cyclohydrolase, FolE2/MptA family [Candidatus Cloacimonadota bacterium]
MNKLEDIQSNFDKRKVAIDKVGVKNVRYPIVVDDRTNGSQNTIADLDIYVDLQHNHRGTHMSRFIEVLNEFHLDNFITNLEEFLKRIKERLESKTAY